MPTGCRRPDRDSRTTARAPSEAATLVYNSQINQRILEKSRGIVGRLLGKAQKGKPVKPVEGFLREEITLPDVRELPVEPAVLPIIEERIEEARRTLAARSYLSVVVLCGSILEAVLLGNAQKEPGLFNRSSASPKGPDGKVKRFHDWTLAQFIDVASDVGILNPESGCPEIQPWSARFPKLGFWRIVKLKYHGYKNKTKGTYTT